VHSPPVPVPVAKSLVQAALMAMMPVAAAEVALNGPADEAHHDLFLAHEGQEIVSPSSLHQSHPHIHLETAA
jgi:hypothetical protein